MAQAATGMAAYTRLFVANALGLAATGVATVALALLAFDLAGDKSGAVLGTALSLKMAVNVVVPPVAAAYAARTPRRTWLVLLSLARAGILFLLPFVGQVWQVYLLVILFEAAAAAYRTTYLAILPDLLRDETEYVRAVAKSRMVYNAESMLSPLLAAALLTLLSFRGLFIVTVVLFVIGAAMTARVSIPEGRSALQGTLARTVRNIRVLLAAPMLRGALAINAAAITINAMVIVNTVVLVRGAFDLDDRAAAVGLAAFGTGGITAALLLPRLLSDRSERPLMIRASATMAALLIMGAGLPGYYAMLALWVVLGAASTLCQLPMETLLRRMSESGDRQGLYAAHYTINHALLLLAYLSAGWVGAEAGMAAAFIGLGLFSALLSLIAVALWPPR